MDSTLPRYTVQETAAAFLAAVRTDPDVAVDLLGGISIEEMITMLFYLGGLMTEILGDEGMERLLLNINQSS